MHTATYNGVTYNVEKLWELAESLPVLETDRTDFDWALKNKTWNPHEGSRKKITPLEGLKFPEHVERMNASDVDKYPILLHPDGWILDGLHRVLKAYKEGRESIPYKQFTEEPTEAIIRINKKSYLMDRIQDSCMKRGLLKEARAIKNASKEYFELFGHVWDVSRAKELIKGRPADGMIDTKTFKSYFGGIAINEEHAKKADLTKPIIIGKVKEWGFPIDGWHRLYRAYQEGIREVPYIKLTSKEDKACRIR